jgi:hypothetical protein
LSFVVVVVDYLSPSRQERKDHKEKIGIGIRYRVSVSNKKIEKRYPNPTPNPENPHTKPQNLIVLVLSKAVLVIVIDSSVIPAECNESRNPGLRQKLSLLSRFLMALPISVFA